MNNLTKFAAVAAIAFSLTACQEVTTGNADVDKILAQASAIAKQTCGITVIAAQIVQVIPNPTVLTAAAIATALCNAVLQSKTKGWFGGETQTGTVDVSIGGHVVKVTIQK